MFFVDNNQKATFFQPYSFPLVVHETRLKDKPMGFNNWHWHEEIQFSLLLEGEMITTAQGQDYHLHAGEGFFINSNLSHMSRPATDPDESRFLSLNVQPSLLTLFHGSVVEQKYYLPYLDDPSFQMIHLVPEISWQDRILADLQALFSLVQNKPFGFELDAYSYLLLIWRQLLDNMEEPEQKPVIERQEAHSILSYIQENYTEDLTLDQVSAHVHLSKSECCDLFRSSYDTTIFSFLSDYRLEKSILLLRDTNRSVSQIAADVGFKGTSYFIKCFREKTGQTPLQYRRSVLKKKDES